MVGQMMWFKRDPKPVGEKPAENGVVGKLRRKKPVILQTTRESSERETSVDSDKERRRYSDILDVVSIERRDESDESLYESADGHSDVKSASDDALPRLSKTPTISKESLKLAVTDEEVDCAKIKKTHRKTMSLSNPLDIVRNLGDEWFESAKKDLEKNSDKKKSKESLWSEEDRDSIHGSTMKLDQIRKNSKKEDKSQSNSRKSSTNEAPKFRKPSKGSSVGGLGFFRRKKTPTSTKPVESVAEDAKVLTLKEIINYTQMFLEGERRLASISEARPQPPIETDSEEEPPTPKLIAEHRRRLSRQTSRSKSKVRGKSQSLKVNTLRKSHSGTLKKGKKKSVKTTPSIGRSRQASIVEQTPIPKKKTSESMKHNSWLFSGSRGESRREGSTDEPTAPDADVDTSDANTKEPDKDNKSSWRSPAGRGVNRAESCRERDAPRRGKHRNASDPNRLTAHNNHDLEPGAATAPSGSSSSSSLSSRSNESNTVPADPQATQSDWSEEDEPLAAQWSESLPPTVLSSLVLCAKVRKRQEVIHELIVSEVSHVRWLRVLGNVFLEPLELSGLLAPEELRSLFPNLPTVREHHARLYADLRAARSEAPNHVVPIRPIADALLNTLGDSGYATSVSQFCRGQRMALDALRERRRKSKELQQFLARREQLQVCGRLQLKDMLACVWQRLTKYQLLLEGILKTADSESEDAEDVSVLRRALSVAKDVLHHVDTAIRTAENEHRLRAIKSKLEIRVAASTVPELEELRRFDLTQHTLRNEGELMLKNDGKKINVLALMLEDSLLLLQREGEKFLLKPFPQPTQQQPLSPLIKWDKVLFRPNAAVRNTFFLMNINEVQMHELSANSAPEYASWVKHIQEASLAKLTEQKASITPSHQASRSTDDSGVNVSRNPSDASEKSSSTVPIDEPTEPERPVDRTSADIEDKEKDDTISLEREDRSSLDKEDEKEEKEEKHNPRRPTVGRISTHGACAGALESAGAVRVRAPAALAAHRAQRAFTDQERLRRLDEVINRALRAKSDIVGAALGVPPHQYAHLADLAVAETAGDIDVSGELRLSRGQLSRSNSAEDEDTSQPDLYQLLLAAHAQATQLTRYLQRAMTVTEADTVAARARSGRCDSCHRVPRTPKHNHQESFEVVSHPDEVSEPESDKQAADALERELSEALVNMDAHDDSACEDSADDALELSGSGALVATRVWRASRGLQHALGRALGAVPRAAAERALREQLAAAREQNDALRAQRPNDHHTNEEVHFPKAGLDPSIQEQPSNGG